MDVIKVSAESRTSAVAGAIAALVATGNVVYTNEFSEFDHGYGAVPARWRVETNQVLPFVEPPSP